MDSGRGFLSIAGQHRRLRYENDSIPAAKALMR
jgi:hypothetical protein